MEKELENTTNEKALPEGKVQEAETVAQDAKPAGRPGSQVVQPVQDAVPAQNIASAFGQPAAQTAAQAADQAGSQPAFQAAPQTTQSIPQPSKPKKTRGKAAKVVALALCCALAGGAVGAGGVICLRHFGIWGRPGRNITRMINGDAGIRGRNRNGQGRSANSNGGSDSFRNRGGNNGGQRKGTGRSGQYRDNVQPGGRYNFGHGRRSQGESNIPGKDQGTTAPDKGSEPTTQTTPAPEQTTPTTGGEAKA